MTIPLIHEKTGVEIRPALHNLRLYSEIQMLLEDIEQNWITGIKRHVKNIEELIKLISKDDYEKTLLEKYFPIGLLTSEDTINIEKLKHYLSELSSSIEKTIIEIGEYGKRGRISKRPLYSYYEMAFTYPLEKLIHAYSYIKGSNRCIIVVPHCHPPFHDAWTLEIGRKIAANTDSHLIYSKLSRIYMDYNRRHSRLTPFRRTLSKVIREEGIDLLIDIHGSKNDEVDIEIGYASGASASIKTIKQLSETLKKYGLTHEYIDVKFTGGDIIRYHSIIGRNEAIQLEISNLARTRKRDKVIKSISEFIKKKCIYR